MGVGVYESDFGGAGSTFLIDGPLAKDEDYESYVKEEVANALAEPVRRVYEAVAAVISSRDESISVVKQLLLAASDAGKPGRLDTKTLLIIAEYLDDLGIELDDDVAEEPAAKIGDVDIPVLSLTELRDATESLDDLEFRIQSKDMWAQDEYNDFNKHMIEVIEESGRALGLGVVERQGFDSEYAGFDAEFTGILSDGLVEVGWRSWETDFVVGVCAGPDVKEYVSNPSTYAGEILLNYRRAPKLFLEDQAALVSSVEEYVRLSLMRSGMDARYKTSGYTAASYAMPDDVDARLSKLASAIKHMRERLGEQGQRILANEPLERAKLIEAVAALHHDNEESGIALCVPYFIPSESAIQYMDPLTHEPVSTATPTPELIEHCRKLVPVASDLVLIPREGDGSIEAWYRTEQARMMNFDVANNASRYRVIVSADEFVDAADDDLVIEYEGDDGQDVVETLRACPQHAPSGG